MTARAAHLIHEAPQLTSEERADMAGESARTDWAEARARIVQSAL